jgi:hypothetical protein
MTPPGLDLLIERGADTTDHPGGTLGAHLRRVGARLADHGTDRGSATGSSPSATASPAPPSHSPATSCGRSRPSPPPTSSTSSTTPTSPATNARASGACWGCSTICSPTPPGGTSGAPSAEHLS